MTVAFVVAIDEQQQQDFARPAAESTDALIPIDGSSDDATVRDKRFLGLFGSLLGGGRGRHYGRPTFIIDHSAPSWYYWNNTEQ